MYSLDITYDEKRCGYWVQGDGFDFFAYFTSGDGGNFIECDHVQRQGDDFTLHLSVRLGPNGQPHADILATALQRELAKYWPTEIT